jgi:hypothetical protein
VLALACRQAHSISARSRQGVRQPVPMAGRIDRNRRLCQHCQCPIGSHAPLRPFPPTLPFDPPRGIGKGRAAGAVATPKSGGDPGYRGNSHPLRGGNSRTRDAEQACRRRVLEEADQGWVCSLATMLLSYCADTSDVPSASACRAPADGHASRRLWAAQSGATDSTVENTDARNRRPA